MARTESATELTNRLMTSYAIEADTYERLLELSRRQGFLLEQEDDFDGCAALFEVKDELLRTIAAVEAEIEPLKRRWWTEEVPQADRDRFNALLDSILTTIEELMEQEQRNEQLLLACQQATRADLGHIHRGVEMQRAQAEDAPAPRFMDTSR